MTKKEYERISELLKQEEYYHKIIDELLKGKEYILLVKAQIGKDQYQHRLTKEEFDVFLNWVQSKRNELYIQLKELGYYE